MDAAGSGHYENTEQDLQITLREMLEICRNTYANLVSLLVSRCVHQLAINRE